MAQQDHSLLTAQSVELTALQRRRKRRSVWRWSLALLTLTAFGALGTVYALGRAYNGQIVQNISIDGLNVSGMTPEAARLALRERHAALFQAPLTLHLGGRSWTPTIEEAGLDVAIDTAVDQAFGVGRGPDVIANLVERGTLLNKQRNITLQVELDERRLAAYLDGLSEELAIAPEDATLAVVNGQVVTTPSRLGQAVATNQITAQVAPGLLALQPQVVELEAQMIAPALDERGIAEAQRGLMTLLAQPATVQISDQQRTWSPAELGALIRIERSTGAAGDSLTATLITEPIVTWLAEVAPLLEQSPVEPRLGWSAGAVQISEPGSDGARLDQATALAQITEELWRGQGQITIALTAVPPAIRPETLASLGIVELVAEGRSDFSGSAPYRIQNIRAGAAQMNGVVLAPGEEFSFNKQVGAIDASNGFTEGYAIIQGRTQLEWGGGVCQVSTTVFRAAFWAGVPITERNQHSFRIRWYEVYEPIGMDAAIFTGPGGYDLRFVNDTGNWLLLQTQVDLQRTQLTVRLYGTKPDREVIQTGPEITNERPAPTEPRYVPDPDLPPGSIKQTDTRRGGMDVRVGRIVRQNGQVLYRDSFLSRYQPWPDIFALGPGATPPTPSPVATDPALAPTAPAESLPATTPQPGEVAPTSEGGSSEVIQSTPEVPATTPTVVP
ncbi:MAG: VanW family protein [Chloroflexi bacterium OHK40]